MGGAQCGARRGVGLPVMVQFDDLDSREELRSLRREAHHQYRSDREVGCDENVRLAPLLLDEGADLVIVLRLQPGRAHNDVDRMPHAPAHIVHHRRGVREVDGTIHLGLAQHVDLFANLDRAVGRIA